MKNLKKIRLKEFGQVLKDQEMKLVLGGIGVYHSCYRIDDNKHMYFFDTENRELSTAWSNFWTATGQEVHCDEYGSDYSRPTVYY